MVKRSKPVPRTLADKLDHLFNTVHPAGRGEYTSEEVAAGCVQRGGPTISATYIWQLRHGKKDNPTKKHIEALAGFFGVPAAYFFDDDAARDVDAQLALLTAMRDANVRHIALRADGLSTNTLKALATMVEQARLVEGLATKDPPPR